MMLLRSLLFELVFFAWTAACSIALLAFRPFGFRAAWFWARAWSRGVLVLLRALCGVRLRIESEAPFPEGVAVALAKHQSALETIAMPIVLPPFCWVLKRELLRIPLFGWALAAVDAIAIRRNTPRKALKQVLDDGMQRLQDGRWVAIFPEGTRVAPGETGKYQPSGVMLAKKAGVAIVPIAVATGHVWPKGSWIKRPGTAAIRILAPIPAHEVRAMDRDALLALVKQRIEAATRALERETGACAL